MFPVKPEQLHVHFGKYRVGGANPHKHTNSHRGSRNTTVWRCGGDGGVGAGVFFHDLTVLTSTRWHVDTEYICFVIYYSIRPWNGIFITSREREERVSAYFNVTKWSCVVWLCWPDGLNRASIPYFVTAPVL